MAIFQQKGCTPAFRSLSWQLIPQLIARARIWIGQVLRLFIASLLCLTISSCAQSDRPVRLLDLPDRPVGNEVKRLSGDISEVAPPAIFLDLANLASDLQPQVEIAYPKTNQVLNDTELTAKIKLRGFSIYKEEATELGPHLNVILDNKPAQQIYDLSDPIAFSDLAPGSHTLRVFAVRPWGESFKNEGAYAQTTFHIFAKTTENTPDPTLPLLTYSEPQGTFGAQPVLLDFYLSNAPLHLVAQEDATDNIQDWQIQCTINGQNFLFEQWQPVYLKGLKQGQNWVQLSLIDEQGQVIDNAFNSTVRLITYDPEQKDTLAQLVRGELSVEQVGQIIVPDYEPPVEPLPAEPESEEILLEETQSEEMPIEEIIEGTTEQAPAERSLDEQLDKTSDLDNVLDKDIYNRENGAVEDERLTEDAQIDEAPSDLLEKNDTSALTNDLDTNRTEVDDAEVDSAETGDTEVDRLNADTFSEIDIDKDNQLNAPLDTTAVEETTLEDIPVEDAPVEDAPAEEITVEKTAVEETTAKDTPAEDIPAKDIPAKSVLIPNNLSAPLKESEESAVGISDVDENLPTASFSQDEAAEPEALPQTGFLERLKAKLRSFQKTQIESQSKTLRPSDKPVAPILFPDTESDLRTESDLEVDTPLGDIQ